MANYLQSLLHYTSCSLQNNHARIFKLSRSGLMPVDGSWDPIARTPVHWFDSSVLENVTSMYSTPLKGFFKMPFFKCTPFNSTLLQSFLRLYTNPKPRKKGFAPIYSLLNFHSQPKKLLTMLQWESDMGVTLIIHQWSTALKWTGKASKCLFRWETVQKILHRWYFTP